MSFIPIPPRIINSPESERVLSLIAGLRQYPVLYFVYKESTQECLKVLFNPTEVTEYIEEQEGLGASLDVYESNNETQISRKVY